MYLDAEKIIHVMDNLNTHKPSSLYKRYPPGEARRILRRLEIHYIPKHGSWLDIAEIELVMTRQCLSRRIAEIGLLRSELSAWEAERKMSAVKVNCHFRTSDARIKFSSLYPRFTTASLGSSKSKYQRVSTQDLFDLCNVDLNFYRRNLKKFVRKRFFISVTVIEIY